MQRVCKYQLLLTELLRTVPETAYPLTYSGIKKVLEKNAQAIDRINTVVGDPNLRIRIKKTISLHERLDYGDQVSQSNLHGVYIADVRRMLSRTFTKNWDPLFSVEFFMWFISCPVASQDST